MGHNTSIHSLLLSKNSNMYLWYVKTSMIDFVDMRKHPIAYSLKTVDKVSDACMPLILVFCNFDYF